jgi:hypothetical protein
LKLTDAGLLTAFVLLLICCVYYLPSVMTFMIAE